MMELKGGYKRTDFGYEEISHLRKFMDVLEIVSKKLPRYFVLRRIGKNNKGNNIKLNVAQNREEKHLTFKIYHILLVKIKRSWVGAVAAHI